MAPRSSLGKFRRAVPEVWFRIVHVAADHFKSSVELREQTIEVALGPDGAFENGNIGFLTRQVPADRVVCAVPAPRHPSRPPQPLGESKHASTVLNEAGLFTTPPGALDGGVDLRAYGCVRRLTLRVKPALFEGFLRDVAEVHRLVVAELLKHLLCRLGE